MFTLRDYQQRAVEAGIELFKGAKDYSGVAVLPTGSGKSLVIASVAKELQGNTIVFQPNLEILKQNLAKTEAFGVEDIGIFSASAGRKDIGKITFATIGSIHNKPETWDLFHNIIVDECHLVNAREGMYKKFIEHNGGRVMGLTATPYRLRAYQDMSGERSVVAQVLTRTRPKVFDKMIHITQIQKLYEEGYLCPIEYQINEAYNHNDIELNSTGMDFDERSLKEYNEKQNVVGVVEDAIKDLDAKHILVFNVFVAEAEQLSEDLRAVGIRAETISAMTPAKDRERIIREFRSGHIKVVTNVGVLTTGFDFPELDCVILARPTQSVALYYQMVGRGIRTAPNKTHVNVIDVCGNVPRFGKIETFQWVAPEGKENLIRLRSNRNYLTGFDVVNNIDLEAKNYSGYNESEGWNSDIVPFGKFKGIHIAKVPNEYLTWFITLEGNRNTRAKELFQKEYTRRFGGG